MGVYTQAAHGCMSAYWESLSDYFEAGQPIPKQFTMNFKCFEILEREDVKQDPYYLEFMLWFFNKVTELLFEGKIDEENELLN